MSPHSSETLRDLSERLVALQQPIRILDAIAWDDAVRLRFFASGCQSQPAVDLSYYATRPLRFEPAELRAAFAKLEVEVRARLGSDGAAARILARMCQEYALVTEMLAARGTARFAPLAAELYGRSSDPLYPGQPTLRDLALLMDEALDAIDRSAFVEASPREIPCSQAVELLQARLDGTMRVGEFRVRVSGDDGIVADAAAGSDYIKLRADRLFSHVDLALLEAHEGWVHVGTTLNGRAQRVCTFLGKGTPATTITQEGLAVLVEVTSLRSHPARLRRVTDRIRAIQMAEEGATFLDVFRALSGGGRSRDEVWSLASRIFRGSLPTGGPFPKDLSYTRGFVGIYNFLRVAVRRGRADRIPLLFVGKVRLEELGLLADLYDQGLLDPPRFLPPTFADPAPLISWMAYSNFLNRLDLARIEPELAGLLR